MKSSRKVVIRAAATAIAIASCAGAFASSIESNLSPEAEEQLYALGYLRTYSDGPQQRGVTVHDANRTAPGLNLVLSPHMLGASLMNADGNTVHEWAFDVFKDIERYNLPDYVRDQEGNTYDYWSRVEPVENGAILVVYKHVGLFKLDRDSNIIWKNWMRAHHDAEFAPDGSIYTIGRVDRTMFEFEEVVTRAEDYIAHVAADGETIDRISIDNAFRRSPYAPLLRHAGDVKGYLHSNKVVWLDGRWADQAPAFRKGNLLVSCRNIDTIAVIDAQSKEVVWALHGMWVRQHEPIMLDDTMLIFDNRGYNGQSRVMELNPFTQDVVWSYAGSKERPFFTEIGGVCQRLSNGNTLITESTQGRAFEVTPEKEIVWEYLNPAKVKGSEGRISPLFEVRRLEDYDTSWLE